MTTFANWSGLVQSEAAEVREVATLAEVVAAVSTAVENDWSVRTVGTTHSHSEIMAATDAMVLKTDTLVGDIEVDADALTVRIPAGRKLHSIGDAMWDAGLSLPNQGDVDVQSIGGLVGTGVHGTGPRLPNISSAVVDATIVIGDGSVVRASDDADVLEAARLNLGALGVVTDLMLQAIPAYHLHERQWKAPFDEIVGELDDRIAATRHFEFFWYPGNDTAYAKSLDLHPGPPDAMEDARGEYVDRAYRVFPSDRADLHTELEYSLPAAVAPEALREIRALMQGTFTDVAWPVEYRTVAADDGWISPASGRNTVTISVHQAIDQPYVEFFAAAEAVFVSHDGRPHWGKYHTRDATYLAAQYGEGWTKFWDVQRRLDPDGRFLNDHLRSLRPEA